ncbi:RNA polymerase sigma factor [Adhaeribacter radiodurans]|uniref:Sigma-70 family RNA polymerase sigma factor n=1 Tax=Adhaeribacter radiodurans TaxID=2745197 RepID=A0A7L7LAK3_9BACT|nr:sigma-70 family RNA polymerase sigma factor [Adhaeribacter radiodurans]QMU29861.1 sigma-70 family RNA polymerase sigma factor [Adhaeribacter radiodurans]
MALILPFPALHETSFQQHTDLPEQELWESLRQGNEAALAQLHKTYYKSLFRYGVKLSHNPDISEDCIQDLFANLWASRQQISAVQSIKFYLFTSYRRLVLVHLKKQQKLLTQIFKPDATIVFSAEEITVQSEANHEIAQKLTSLLNNLPKRQREVLYLRYYEDLSLTEIAQLMDLSYQSVLNYIQRALTNIRQQPEITVLLSRSSLKLVTS